MIRKITVNAGDGYEVKIGDGMLAKLNELLPDFSGAGKAAVVTDSTVAPLYLEKTLRGLKNAGFDVFSYVIAAGEQSKNMATLCGVLDFFAENTLTRHDAAISLGGGVVGDITGFAAGIYRRGISYVQLPTTLLACVDSSVGGKTAVNLSAGKNLAGVFHQPSAVICDTACLTTLPDEIYSQGLAEAIKCAVIADRELFSLISASSLRGNADEIIGRCVKIKADIVSMDEFDCGKRQILNFGHTPAHAMEKLSGFSLPHGQAVAMGMCLMTRAAEKMGVCEKGTAEQLVEVLRKKGLPTECDFSASELFKGALSDKKLEENGINIILPEIIGRCVIRHIDTVKLEDVFRLGLEK